MKCLLKKYFLFNRDVFSTFLPLVLRAECTDWQMEINLMMYCMFHKVKNVNALLDCKLSVQFCEGVTKIYNVAPLFEKHSFFLPLKDSPELFSSVVVEQGGYSIIWNDDIDISCDELWTNDEEIDTPFDGLMAFSDASFF